MNEDKPEAKEGLTPAEQALLKEIVTAYSLFKVLSRWGRWLALTMFVLAVALSQLLDAIAKIWHYVKGVFSRL